MSNNSFACIEGGEVGRAQAAQAEACGIEAHPDMNPVLLKPNGPSGCQIVVNGRVWRDAPAREYYDHFPFLLDQVLAAWERLTAAYEFIVIEGAGSIAELNLRGRDLVNLGLASRVGAPALLVADIERGGVFASILGSFCALEDSDRALVRSFLINKFRGDISLFDDGRRILEARTNRRCLGVFPAVDIPLDEEDSLALENHSPAASAPVAILRFPAISNFSDFRLLPFARWVAQPVSAQFDAVILPGSKNTLADLRWLRAQGLDRWILDQHAGGARIVGICGGYQMLGEEIRDDAEGSERALGLLPVSTYMLPVKTTRQVSARLSGTNVPFHAYEIHMGETQRPDGSEPVAYTEHGPEGVRSGRVYGTYLHGALENADVCRSLLGVEPASVISREQTYDRLADWFEHDADLALFEELYL